MTRRPNGCRANGGPSSSRSAAYRQDFKIEDLKKQRGIIARYLNTVDEVLFWWGKNGVRAGRMRRSAWHERNARA